VKKLNRFKLILIFILSALILGAWSEGEAFNSFGEFLVWLGAVDGGAWILASWFFSWIFEYFPKWRDAGSRFKVIIIGVLTLLIWSGSNWLVDQPNLVGKFEGVFDLIQVWLATQLAHRLNSKSGEPIG
jgi:hypothetical protein